MPVIDYKDAIAPYNDVANREIVRRINAKTIQLASFCTSRNATWAADKGGKLESYPIARITFSANRKFFRWKPGEQFKFTYNKWGVKDLICRVDRITEENLDTGTIQVVAVEDIDHIAGNFFGEFESGKWPVETQDLSSLDNVAIAEAPYFLVGDVVSIIPLAAKQTGAETGYYLYQSIDGGSSYQQISIVNVYQIYGTLVESYGDDTWQIDEQSNGILIDFDVADTAELDKIQTITRVQMLTKNNLALLGNEIISFQTVTPVTTTRYRLSNIFRGRFDTLPQNHSPGENFWFMGNELYKIVNNTNFNVGAARKFKMVPFNAQTSGEISDATAVDHTIEGRGKKPYQPTNLKANGSTIPFYTGDINLTWTARWRGIGAGIGDPQTVVDAAPDFEFTFTVEVYVSSILVRTTTGIEDDEWTYSSAMNITDNSSLASEVVFKVKHVRTDAGNTFESDTSEITVNKET